MLFRHNMLVWLTCSLFRDSQRTIFILRGLDFGIDKLFKVNEFYDVIYPNNEFCHRMKKNKENIG